MIIVANIQNLNELSVGDAFVGIQGNVHIGFFLYGFNQKLLNVFECDVSFFFVTESHVLIQVPVHYDPCQRFGRGLLLALGQQYLDGVGMDYRRGDHEKDKQQKDDVGHRRHAEARIYLVLSF
jgi:hypothetical protein